jgi:hypothetical protein
LHVQIDNAAVKAVKGDVAAILRHGRPHAGVQQLLDLAHDIAISPVMLGMARGRLLARRSPPRRTGNAP